MNSSNEIWDKLDVQSILEIPDFPFASHEAFVDAIRSEDAIIGIECSTARNIAHLTLSPIASIACVAIGNAPIIFALSSIFVAFITGQWATLVAIPAAVIGGFVAGPYLAFRYAFFIGALAAGLYYLIESTAFTTNTWSIFPFILTFLAFKFCDRITRGEAYKAVLNSEAMATYLWATKKLGIKIQGEIVRRF